MSNVAVAPSPPKPAEPANNERFAPKAHEAPPNVDGPREITPDNTQAEIPAHASVEEPKDFGTTLHDRIQPEEPQKKQNPTKPEAKTSSPEANPTTKEPGKLTTDQAEAVVTKLPVAATIEAAKADVQVTLEAETTLPQAQADKTSEKGAELLNSSKMARLPDLTADVAPQTAKTGDALPETAGKVAQLAVLEGKAISDVGQPEIAKELVAAQSTPAQAAKAPAPNETPAAQQGLAIGREIQELVSESTPKSGGSGETAENLGTLIKQIVSEAVPAKQADTAVAKGLAPDAQSQSQPQPQTAATEKPANPFGEPETKENTQNQTPTILESSQGDGKEAELSEKAFAGDSFFQKINPSQIQVTAQTKGKNAQASDGSSTFNTDLEQAVSANSPRIPLAEQPKATTQTPKSAAGAESTDVSSTVSDQIRESIRTSIDRPDQEITVRLNPPELGRVLIKFQEQGEQITGLLEVSKAETRAEIQQALPEIMRNLQALGVQVKRIDVVLTDESQRQMLNGESPDDNHHNWSAPEDMPNPTPQSYNVAINELLANSAAYGGTGGADGLFVTDKSIDMLA